MKWVKKMVYQIKISVAKRFIKTFIRLKSVKRVFLSLHFPILFSEVFSYSKTILFQVTYSFIKGYMKIKYCCFIPCKTNLKKIHPLDQLGEGLITPIYRVKVDRRVAQIIDHLHLLRTGRSQDISVGWSFASTVERIDRRVVLGI